MLHLSFTVFLVFSSIFSTNSFSPHSPVKYLAKDTFMNTQMQFKYTINHFVPIVSVYITTKIFSDSFIPRKGSSVVLKLSLETNESIKEIGELNSNYLIFTESIDSAFAVYQPRYENFERIFTSNSKKNYLTIKLKIETNDVHENKVVEIDISRKAVMEYINADSMVTVVDNYRTIGLVVLSFFFLATGIVTLSIIVLMEKIYKIIVESKNLVEPINVKKMEINK